MKLTNKKCVPCEGGIPPLNSEEAEILLKNLSSEWKLSNNKLIRSFKFVNFKHNMSFVNKLAEIAEEEGHHPDFYISYASLQVELWTHAINGLSMNDFIVAGKIDEL